MTKLRELWIQSDWKLFKCRIFLIFIKKVRIIAKCFFSRLSRTCSIHISHNKKNFFFLRSLYICVQQASNSRRRKVYMNVPQQYLGLNTYWTFNIIFFFCWCENDQKKQTLKIIQWVLTWIFFLSLWKSHRRSLFIVYSNKKIKKLFFSVKPKKSSMA